MTEGEIVKVNTAGKCQSIQGLLRQNLNFIQSAVGRHYGVLRNDVWHNRIIFLKVSQYAGADGKNNTRRATRKEIAMVPDGKLMA